MSSMSGARFQLVRALGLIRRGWTSLRVRGWRPTWQRVSMQLRVPPSPLRAQLWFPAEGGGPPPAFQPCDRPRASVVIPVHNHVAHTLACLRALAEHPPCNSCEIIVVDDGSGDRTATALPAIAGLRYHRRPVNGGFIAACNDGAALARGEFLVFLNNDTVPQPGWLDRLLGTFDEHGGVGLVGAQLLYRDGRLQEAGGLVFADGSCCNYGRFESPEDPRFAHLRDADYVSGAAIAIPRLLFAELGGFDRRYAPAYYEDTDLAFAVREAGRRVLYQPAARVVHDEGTTAGTDAGVGAKAFQARNRERFAAHRAEALRAQPAPSSSPSPTLLHPGKRQILVVGESTPRPDHDSGSLRLVNLIGLLREGGAHVVFVPADRQHAGRYTDDLQQMGVEAWHAPFLRAPPAWLREHGPRFDSVLLGGHHVAREFLPLVRRHAPQARALFDSIDLHYLRERRAAELARDPILMRAAQRTRAAELDVIARADLTLVVGEAERLLLASDAPGAPVEVLSNLHRVVGPGLPFAQRQDLVFVGGFRHQPNLDGVRWFVEQVFPLLRAMLPGVRFHCIGSHPTAAIVALGRIEGVVVHGHVADIAPYMERCRIAIAPLRFGAGVKGKVNLSMAHGQPVVATPCAVESMHLVPGRDVLVADSPAGFAEHVARAYRDEALWTQLSVNGLDNVARHFSLDSARATVRRIFLAPPPDSTARR